MTLTGIKVLHVFDHSLPMHSGYSFRSISLLREQRKRGWETCQLTTPRHTREGAILETVEEFDFHRTSISREAKLKLPVIKELAQIRNVAHRIQEVARTEKPDLLHAHSPVLNAISALIAARNLKLPVVYEVRALWEDAAVSHGTASQGGPRYQATRALETYAFKRCDAVVTICEGLRQEIIRRGIAPEIITTVPNGVDIEEFAANAIPNKELLASLDLEGKLVLGFLGSFYEYEGLEDLLLALRTIIGVHQNVVLLLAGGGPLEETLKQQARTLGIEHAVRFVGRIPHDQVPQYYRLIDVFVYPRRPMRLTELVTPLKPLEAMARRGIVLASDVGGHRELITDTVTGYLYPAGNIQALANAVLRLIPNRYEWTSVGERARQYVEQERSWTVTTAGYEGAYSRAIHAGRRPKWFRATRQHEPDRSDSLSSIT